MRGMLRDVPLMIGLLFAVLGCVTGETHPGRERHVPLGAGVQDRAYPDPMGVLWTGPGFLGGTPLQGLWTSTIGLVTTPVFLPWYGTMWMMHGREEAQRRVYGVLEPVSGQPLPNVGLRMPREVDFGSYHALIIANARYTELQKLETPLNDAMDLAAILSEDYGFSVEVVADVGRGEILSPLHRLRRELTEHDNLLIYYAGHGYLDEESAEGYWLPIDSNHEDIGTWLSNATVATQIKAMRAKHVLVVSDSCYAGTLMRGSHWRMGSAWAHHRLARYKARQVLTSGGLEPVVDQGDGRNSVFAGALLRALRDNRGVLEGSILFSQLRRAVIERARQTPEFAPLPRTGHDGGEFLFVRTEPRVP